jgi:hypothetical protein
MWIWTEWSPLLVFWEGNISGCSTNHLFMWFYFNPCYSALVLLQMYFQRAVSWHGCSTTFLSFAKFQYIFPLHSCHLENINPLLTDIFLPLLLLMK